MSKEGKYIIHASIRTDGTVARKDVIGAIFGQTEGLLGDELQLRKIFKIDDSEHRAIARSMDRQLEEVVHRTLKDEVRIRLYDSIDRMGDIFDNILVKNEDRK